MFSIDIKATDYRDRVLIDLTLTHPNPDRIAEAFADPRFAKIMINSKTPRTVERTALNKVWVRAFEPITWDQFRGPLVDPETAKDVVQSKVPPPAKVVAVHLQPTSLHIEIDLGVDTLAELNQLLHIT